MYLKKELTLLLTLCVLGSALPPSVTADSSLFQTNEGHGYRWSVDYSDFRSEITEGWKEVDHSYISGGASEMLYIKCKGNESGKYSFEYFGGNYVDLYMSVSGRNESGFYRDIEYRARYSINYNGSFIAVKHNYSLYSGGEEHSYYGMERLVVNVGGEININIREEGEKSGGKWSYYMSKISNICYSNLSIEFEEPYPFVPADLSNWIYNNDIRIKYSGLRRGYIDYSAEYPDGKKDSLKAYVGRHVSGTATVSLYSEFFSNGTMHAPSLIGLSQLVDITPYNGYLLGLDEKGLEMQFWQRYGNGTISAIGQKAGPIEYIVWSENASEDEVREYLQDKEAYTPHPTGNISTNLLPASWFLLSLASLSAFLIILFVLRRIRKKGL